MVNVYPPPPAPQPPPVVAPEPQPIAVAPVYMPDAGRPDPARVHESIHRFRRGAVGLLVLGSVGMTVAVGMQFVRADAMSQCGGGSLDVTCNDAEDLEVLGAYYSGLGMIMAVGASAGAGSMLGKAAAQRDVQLRNGAFRSRRGAKILGVATVVAASAWVVGANMTLLEKEAQCDTAECMMQYRPLRYAANDAGVLGLAAGSAMLGYAVAYDKQGHALMKLRASPSLTRRSAGVALSGRF